MPRRFLRGAARGAVAAGAFATRRGAGSGEARVRDADDDDDDDDDEDEEAGFRTGTARMRRGWPADLAGAGTGLKNLESSWSMVLKDLVRGPPIGLISRGGKAGKAGRDEAAATEEEEEEEEAAGSSCTSSGRESSRSSSKLGAGFAGLSIDVSPLETPLGAFQPSERGS